MTPQPPTLIDLFSGCGGFSLGAELAGFRSLVAVDIEPTLQSGFKKNFPRTKALQADVGQIREADWPQLIGRTRPDGIIGGPPCQGFSRIGKRSKEDPRNTLIDHFYRHVEELTPKFFIMENVEGLLDECNRPVLMQAIERIAGRYRIIGPLVVNAADYGAATNRKRVVVVGYDPLECDPFGAEYLLPANGRTATVQDAISDLPSPIRQAKDPHDFGWAAYREEHAALSEYASALRELPPDGLGWKVAIDKLHEGLVSGSFETIHSAEVANRYIQTPSGTADKISKSYKLAWGGLCPTLRAGTGAEKGAFQAVRPLHPEQGRVITVREAARMQAFPDWFVFHPTKWHSFRMIGNSVSPSVSFGLLSRIREKLATVSQSNYNTKVA
ncbi:DNA cytosine methyltransferase [Achromobacter insolitus]|uniref:DNA cytosine methyltransferase n=1 Tax=Achromobacter insolitus TaxID=217204 RepID=UPI00174ACE95|nr:DNA cytosine methyltransferase [Achromobacter insolitus]